MSVLFSQPEQSKGSRCPWGAESAAAGGRYLIRLASRSFRSQVRSLLNLIKAKSPAWGLFALVRLVGLEPMVSGLHPSTAVRNGICRSSFADTYCSLGCRFAESATGGAHLCPSGAVQDGTFCALLESTYPSPGFRFAAFPYGEGAEHSEADEVNAPPGHHSPLPFGRSSRWCLLHSVCIHLSLTGLPPRSLPLWGRWQPARADG